MRTTHVLLPAVLLLAAACSTPTLAQRQDAWRLYRDSVRATCVVGDSKDPAMPDDVRAWCKRTVEP